MKREVMALLFTCWFALSAFGASWETSGFRTAKGKLIQSGMLMTEVRQDAGEPLDRQVTSVGVNSDGKTGEQREVWTYRGSDGVYSLTFSGNRLTKIEVTAFRD